jgi:GxxExxY protein
VALPVIYESVQVDAGLRMDMLIEKYVIVEIKSVDTMNPVYEAQLHLSKAYQNSPGLPD